MSSWSSPRTAYNARNNRDVRPDERGPGWKISGIVASGGRAPHRSERRCRGSLVPRDFPRRNRAWRPLGAVVAAPVALRAVRHQLISDPYTHCALLAYHLRLHQRLRGVLCLELLSTLSPGPIKSQEHFVVFAGKMVCRPCSRNAGANDDGTPGQAFPTACTAVLQFDHEACDAELWAKVGDGVRR
jgi:hypothetical protein